MIEFIQRLVGVTDFLKNVNWKRYCDEDEGDILLWYDRPQVIFVPYENKNYTLTLFDDFNIEGEWTDIFIINDVTGIDKESIVDSFYESTIDSKEDIKYGIVLSSKSVVIDYIEFL